MPEWFVAFMTVLGFGVILITIIVFTGRKSNNKNNRP